MGVAAGLACAGQAVGFQAAAPAGQAAAPAGKLNCSVDRTAPSEADKALSARRYSDAERLYGEALTANPASGAAMAGLVRASLGEDKVPEALALAIKYQAAQPNDPMVLDALGEVRFRRGEVDEAAMTFNKSMQLSPCLGRTHYDESVYMRLSGRYGSSQRQLEVAHSLSPDNEEISRRWRQSHAVPATAEQRLEILKASLDQPELTDERKDGINAAIKGIETREKGDCQLVQPVKEVKLPMLPIGNGGPVNSMYAAGLEVQFNGKKKRLEIDTGASGLLLSRSVAKSAGLIPELEVKAGGIGDHGPAGAFVTHVDDIRIGSMEFRNCMVSVLEHSSVLDVDGLIGPDVFRDYVVTLDIPGREVRLSPLPRRPDEQMPQITSLDTSDDDDQPLSQADRAKDRYIAPEMKDWTPVFRYDHFLIFPTSIGKAPAKLFIMDTGAQSGMITPDAAREVTHVSSDTDRRVKGISGEVQNVFAADHVTIAFARVKQNLDGMTSYNSALITRRAGVEISGLIGFPTLRELVISIDYRDNLVNVVYDPNKGFHNH